MYMPMAGNLKSSLTNNLLYKGKNINKENKYISKATFPQRKNT